MKIILPNGLLDGQDLFNVAIIDELRGKQQNYLANRELVIGNIGHIPKILADCVKSLETAEGVQWKGNMEDAVEKLSAGDLEILLIKIRENTYGERFYFEAECTHCQHKNKNLRIDLDKLEVEPLSVIDMLDKERVSFELPKSKKKVQLKPLYLKDLFESIKIMKNKPDKLITSAIALSIKSIDAKTKITSDDIDELPSKDLMFLKDKLESIKLEGTIDTKVEVNCQGCGKDFESKMDVYSSDFFDPSKGSMSTTT